MDYEVLCLGYHSLVFDLLLHGLGVGPGIYRHLCTWVSYVIFGRVPGSLHHLGLRRNQRFFRQKQDGNKMCPNSCMKVRCTKTMNLHWNPFFLKFVYSYFVYLYKNHGKRHEMYQNLQYFSVYIGIWVAC